MPNTDIKAVLIKYGIFTGVVFVLSMLLLTFVLIAHAPWKHGLTQTVQETLNYYYPDSYTVGDFHEIASTISTSAALFTVKSRKANSTELSAYCVLVRIPTITGAQPALFLYSTRYGASFVGYAIDTGKADYVLRTEVNKASISYWQKQIPEILEKAGVR